MPDQAISIVVPCRNEGKSIAEVLDSILAQDLAGFDWEILIADGMSDDGTRDILERATGARSRASASSTTRSAPCPRV
jgi:glycosyltransferase involved in cell wall biosynthesis